MRHAERACFQALLSRWLGRIFIDSNRDPSASVVLCGRERTGTTWMAEVINYDRSYRCMFEPFHPLEVEEVLHFGLRKYIRPGVRDPRFVKPVESILRGDIRSAWIDWKHCQNPAILFRRRLVKTVRANLFLGWMRSLYPDTPIVLAIRHPCATTCSIMRKGWPPTLPVMMNQPDLVSDFLEPYVDLISCAETTFEKHIVSWCIDYFVVLKQFSPGDIYLLFYESMVGSPEDEITGLFDFLGKDYDEKVMNVLQTPSVTATRESRRRIEVGGDLLARWQRELSVDQIDRCMDFLQAFGLDRVYSDASMPSRSAALEFMRENTS